MIGMITPPYSELLFVVTGITGIPLASMYRHIRPFIAALVAALPLMQALPEIVLWLPLRLGLSAGRMMRIPLTSGTEAVLDHVPPGRRTAQTAAN